uniref:Protein argonaute 11 n=1 Tax=Oryza sativa subsp. japonica TaxID=39947 RepID=AGO11_ORYSJ|nr:RecName: Full=Protein argonaute 11; Short=OsAGO11 [Oryza sativa Japonica Group]
MSSRGGGVGGRRGGPGGASSVRGGERGRKRGRGALDAVEPRVPLPRGTGSGPGAGRDGAAAPVPALQPAEADVLSGEVETEMAAGMEAREGASSSSSASAPAVGEVEPPSRAVGALPPTSSKAVVLQARPGFGTVGTSCRVRANHFVVQLADKEIYHYDVAIAPELRSRERNRNIINELLRSHKKYLDGRRSPAYDGRKGMFTAGALPFTDREFVVKIANDPERGNQGEKEFKVTIKCAGAANLYMHSLKQFLAGTYPSQDRFSHKHLDIRILIVALNGGEDISATTFYKAQPVIDFALDYLNMNIRDAYSRFDQDGTRVSVVQYFNRQYSYSLKYINWPCLQAGSDSRPTYLPMEVCRIVKGQRYSRKLNECQVTRMLRLARETPEERENSILEIANENNYGNDYHAREFGIGVTNQLALVDARVLPAPMLKYHDSGQEKVCNPSIGQWNMNNKRMLNGGSINYWACLTFASCVRLAEVRTFCKELVRVCNSIGMQITGEPCVRIRQERQDHLDAAVRDIHRQSAEFLSQQGVIGQQLELLVIVLPDANATVFYGRIKRLCETELGVITQCCLARNVQNVGGRNTVLEDALHRRIPLLTDMPTMIFGADVTHPPAGEDSSPSIAAVVASMDWPEVSKYKCSVSSQSHREEIIADLFTEVKDSQNRLVYGGMIRELIESFRKANGSYKPGRIIFYRDGVSEGQFSQVLLSEMDAIRKACASIEEGYLPPVTFVVVQKRHHTRLFPEDHHARDQMDRSRNILPGTVVDTKICHPSEFDFYLCSHSGIQGTSHPTHYYVLFDENNFSADALQTLTYHLCYTYARCTRSVSIVPPVYYAHLAASRARHYLEEGSLPDHGSSSASAAGGSRRNDRGVPVKPLPEIKENVKQFMFYC